MKKLKAIGQTGKSARTLKGTTKNPLAIETLAGDGLIPHKKCWGSHLHVMRYADFKKCKICCPRTTLLSWDNNWDRDTSPRLHSSSGYPTRL